MGVGQKVCPIYPGRPFRCLCGSKYTGLYSRFEC